MWRSFSAVMVNVLDSDIVVSEFELRSRYYVHFLSNTRGKSMHILICSVMGEYHYCYFYKDGFGIK